MQENMPAEVASRADAFFVTVNDRKEVTGQLSTAAADWIADRDEILKRGDELCASLKRDDEPPVITSDADLEAATKIAKKAKALVKQLASKRLDCTRPLDAMRKAFMEAEKRESEKLNKLIATLDGLAAAYARELARKAEEERRRIEAAERAAAEAGLAARAEAEAASEAAAAANAAFGFGAPTATPAPVAPMSPILTPVPTVQKASSSSASFVEKWDFEILDPNVVPRELCSPDDAKIRAFLAGRKADGYKPDQVVVAGLRIFMDVQVRAR